MTYLLAIKPGPCLLAPIWCSFDHTKIKWPVNGSSLDSRRTPMQIQLTFIALLGKNKVAHRTVRSRDTDPAVSECYSARMRRAAPLAPPLRSAAFPPFPAPFPPGYQQSFAGCCCESGRHVRQCYVIPGTREKHGGRGSCRREGK